MRTTLASISISASMLAGLTAALTSCSSKTAASPDAPATPLTITITGTASARGISGTTPVVGAVVAAYKVADDSLVTMTTTDGSGNYTLTTTTTGPLDGYLKATFAGDTDTYLYPPAPLAADFTGASINMLTTSNFGLISTLAQGNETAGNGLIAAEVLNASNTPVAGATVASSPASNPYRYDDPSSGLPSSTPTSTGSDGVGYMFNTPPGAVTVSATMTGTTFKSHPMKAWADSLTTTLITP